MLKFVTILTFLGEIWFLCLILLHTSPMNFEDARTVDRTIYPTFQQAALRLNLVTDLNDATVCFEQSINVATPHELSFFATLTVNGFSTLAIWYNENHKLQLLLD